MPKSVLIVEDDALILQAVRTALELRGYRVLDADSGHSALAALEGDVPDLVVLDLTLPDMDGLAFSAELERRGLRSMLRLLVMSADSGGRQKAVRIGAEGYLVKPFQLSTLFEEVARLAGD